MSEPPESLRNFVDETGRLTGWPRKYTRKVIAAQYLAGKFEPGRDYTEAQVNDILEDWHTFNDAAVLRRFLVDLGILARTSNGREYWLVT